MWEINLTCWSQKVEVFEQCRIKKIHFWGNTQRILKEYPISNESKTNNQATTKQPLSVICITKLHSAPVCNKLLELCRHQDKQSVHTLIWYYVHYTQVKCILLYCSLLRRFSSLVFFHYLVGRTTFNPHSWFVIPSITLIEEQFFI